MSAVSEAIENMETVDMSDLEYGPFEVNTAQLAQILGLTRESVNRWAREEIILPEREDGFNFGRPTRVYDLHAVYDHLEMEEAPKYRDYSAKVKNAIQKREKALAEEAEEQSEAMKVVEEAVAARPERTVEIEIGQQAALVDRIDALERLVVSLAAKMKDGEPLSGDESLEILDIVFRRYDVSGS